MSAHQHLRPGLCRGCGQPVGERDRFCEVCGRPDPLSPVVGDVADVPAPGAGAVCVDCGGADVGADGYCGGCGLRQPSGREHVESELDGLAAAVSDLGLRRSRNEDAFALAALPSGACAVVCDGVATAPGSEDASRLAADAAAAVLAGRVSRGADPREATREAVRRAVRIVADLAGDPESGPACTFVSAVVDGPGVTVGWVGDSRAYWLAPGGSRLLTRDDSWAAQMVESGELSAADAWADRRAHLLTAWLGADAGAVEPGIASFRPPGPGLVMLCSDGLWNHLPEPADLAAVALNGTSGPGGAFGPNTVGPNTVGQDVMRRGVLGSGGALAAARRLLRAALDAGGHDNITVAAIPVPPPEPTREPGR
ncbi:MAG TPA: protein phosphatase 2C domain-containing protein [Spirillospora sp.]